MFVNRDLSEKRICSTPWKSWSKISETHSDNSTSSPSAPFPNAFVAKLDFKKIHKNLDISSHPTLSISMTKNRFVLTFRQAYKAYGNFQHDLQQNLKYRYLKISACQRIIAAKKYLYHAHVELNPFSLGQILLICQPTKPLDFSKLIWLYRCCDGTVKTNLWCVKEIVDINIGISSNQSCFA